MSVSLIKIIIVRDFLLNYFKLLWKLNISLIYSIIDVLWFRNLEEMIKITCGYEMGNVANVFLLPFEKNIPLIMFTLEIWFYALRSGFVWWSISTGDQIWWPNVWVKDRMNIFTSKMYSAFEWIRNESHWID